MSWNVRYEGEPRDLDRDEFYRQAIKPGFPNRMAFQLEASPENLAAGRSFSQEGLDNLAEQLKTFILARTLGTWSEEGVVPSSLTVGLQLSFETVPLESLRRGSAPWWHLVDEGGSPIEGGSRLEQDDDHR